jgi:hypothetical protein
MEISYNKLIKRCAMSVAVTRVFVSHSTQNAKFVDPFVERLRDHYIDTWYAPRHMPGGYFAENIRQGLNECDWFLLVLSPDALASDWVRKEIELAMVDQRFYNRVIPVLAAPCDWKNLHQHLARYQLFDFVTQPKEAEARLLRHLGVEPHTFPPMVVGDVKMPVYVFVGGDGKTRFRPGDIVCDGPGPPTDDSRLFVPPDDVAAFAADYLPKREAECRAQEKVFVNNRQVRLVSASWGSSNSAGGLDNRPLRLTLGWTWYFHTAVTNMKTDERLDDGHTIRQKYAAPIDNLADCRLSNPIATNLSIITSDGFIFYGQRSSKVQTMPGGFQPAVSGDGQPEDLDTNGVYDPFRTACREANEEATGDVFPPIPKDVTFFGLGRWMKTRFPFLFGEIRTKLTAKQLESQAPTNLWEGIRLKMPFTVEAVTQWVADRYRDQYQGRAKAAVSSPIFSLLQSLRYEYPTRWLHVIERLDLPDIPPPQST